MVHPAFHRYAEWYDAFNAGKDYADEATYVARQVRQEVGGPKRWLDVGCGTGRHLWYFREQNVEVEGVDSSPSMIERARLACPGVSFHLASAQAFDLGRGWDVISMLFHVLNYQVSDDMIAAAFERVAAHLGPDGVFVFDFWNTDAVRRDPPGPRTRTTEVGGRVLYRLSRPSENPAARTVTVHYEFRWDQPRGELIAEETHVLRHFSAIELSALLRASGLIPRRFVRWLSDDPLSADDWYGFGCATVERST
jgi:SAM-dependent methyltransferase